MRGVRCGRGAAVGARHCRAFAPLPVWPSHPGTTAGPRRRLNVDMLKMIQLGFTFADEQGNLPRINDELCVWQFNFRCAGRRAWWCVCVCVFWGGGSEGF